MTDPWEQAVAELSEWLKLGGDVVVPFVGAGISRAVGGPTWAGLADTILNVCMSLGLLRSDEVPNLKKQSPLEVLSRCRQVLHDETFYRQVTKALEPANKGSVPRVAELLWRINPNLVVTTNLDSVIEHAAALRNEAARPVTPNDAMDRVFQGHGSRVLHLHGVVDRFDTWVMTNDQYEAALHPNTAFRAVFQTMLLDRILLFVGFSCNDVDFNLFLNHFKDNFPTGRSQHFALLSQPSDEDISRLLALGVFPIPYAPTASNHPEVQQFLEELVQRFDPRSVLTSVATGDISLMPVQHLNGLTMSERRDILNREFGQLFIQAKNFALLPGAKLPSNIQARRDETLGQLGECWQIGVTPPYNALEGQEVVEQIGRGGFGVVWKVQDVRTGEYHALKVAHFQETDNYKFVERFKQGILAMKLLTAYGVHNIVKYHSDRDVPLSVVMEYIEGSDLSNMGPGQFPFLTRLRLIREVAHIIADAHAVPVYHRDLKPSNVLLRWDENGEPHAVLSDFDLAWYEGAIARTSTKMGDQAFASPEQLNEASAVKARDKADVYSLGMLASYLIREQSPTAGQWYNQAFRSEIEAALARQTGWRVTVKKLADLVSSCAKFRPEDRPTAAQFLQIVDMCWRAEDTTKVDEPGLFRSEVELRLATPDVPRQEYARFSVQVQLEHGQPFLVASLHRLQNASDDWSRFTSQGRRAIEGAASHLDDRGWSVTSKQESRESFRLAAKRAIKRYSLDEATSISADLEDTKRIWDSRFR